VELFHRRYVSLSFARLAALGGLEHTSVVTEGTEPRGCELSANRLDLTVNVAAVIAALT
jgi:hypothetical protein